MKNSLFAFLLLAISFVAEAQSSDRSVRFGVVATPGLSWLKTVDLGQDRDGVGFAFGYGLQMEFNLGKYIALGFNLTQSNYNATVEYTDSVDFVYTEIVQGEPTETKTVRIVDRTYSFNTIELPIYLKLKTPEIGYLTYFVEAGILANINYKVEASKNTTVTGGFTSNDLADIDANDETNWFRAASVLGGGIEYNLIGNTSLIVGVLWSRAFTSAMEGSGRYDGQDDANKLVYAGTSNAFKQKANLDFINLKVGILF